MSIEDEVAALRQLVEDVPMALLSAILENLPYQLIEQAIQEMTGLTGRPFEHLGNTSEFANMSVGGLSAAARHLESARQHLELVRQSVDAAQDAAEHARQSLLQGIEHHSNK